MCIRDSLYGRDGIAYEDYVYPLPKRKLKRETLIKYYDLIRPTLVSYTHLDVYKRQESKGVDTVMWEQASYRNFTLPLYPKDMISWVRLGNLHT